MAVPDLSAVSRMGYIPQKPGIDKVDIAAAPFIVEGNSQLNKLLGYDFRKMKKAFCCASSALAVIAWCASATPFVVNVLANFSVTFSEFGMVPRI